MHQITNLWKFMGSISKLQRKTMHEKHRCCRCQTKASSMESFSDLNVLLGNYLFKKNLRYFTWNRQFYIENRLSKDIFHMTSLTVYPWWNTMGKWHTRCAQLWANSLSRVHDLSTLNGRCMAFVMLHHNVYFRHGASNSRRAYPFCFETGLFVAQ